MKFLFAFYILLLLTANASLTVLAQSFSKSDIDCTDANCKSHAEKSAIQQKNDIDQLTSNITADCENIRQEEFLKEARAEYANFFPPLPDPPPVRSDFFSLLGALMTQSQINPKVKIWNDINFCGNSDEAQYIGDILGTIPGTEWEKQSKQVCTKQKGGGSCIDVKCSLTIGYNGSEEAALRALVIAKRDGYAVSLDKKPLAAPLGSENLVSRTYTPASWNPSDLRVMDKTLAKLPDSYRKLKGMKSFFRYPEEYRNEGRNVAGIALQGAGEIRFTPFAFENTEWLPEIITHELSHHYDYQGMMDYGTNAPKEFHVSSGFINRSGWRSRTQQVTTTKSDGTSTPQFDPYGNPIIEKIWIHDPNAKFPRSYAATDPREDFADTAAYYVIFPNELLNNAPEKYQFMKEKVFAGREYNNDDAWPALTKEINQQGGKEALIAECLGEIQHSFLENNRQLLLWVKNETGSYSGIYPNSFFNTKNGNPCVRNFAENLVQKFSHTPEYCMYDEKKGIQDILMNQMKYLMGPLMKNFQDYVNKNGADATYLEKSLRATTELNTLKPETQKMILDKLTGLLEEAKNPTIKPF